MYALASYELQKIVHDKELVFGNIACPKCAFKLHEIIEKYRVGKITGYQKND